MKIGDIVMFKPEGRYAKWFAGEIGVIKNISVSKSGEKHCRVEWLQPVPYFGKFTSVSDFPLKCFDGAK